MTLARRVREGDLLIPSRPMLRLTRSMISRVVDLRRGRGRRSVGYSSSEYESWSLYSGSYRDW